MQHFEKVTIYCQKMSICPSLQGKISQKIYETKKNWTMDFKQIQGAY